MFNHIKKRLQNRQYAGWLLAEKLLQLRPADTTVLAIPKGGVPVGHTIASLLGFSFDIVLSKRIRHPAHSDQSIGAVTMDDVIIHDSAELIPQSYILHQVASLRQALLADWARYYTATEKMPLRGKTIVLVDDVLRETEELDACLTSITRYAPERIIVAAPVMNIRALNFLNDHEIEAVYLFSEMQQHHAYTYFPEITQEELELDKKSPA